MGGVEASSPFLPALRGVPKGDVRSPSPSPPASSTPAGPKQPPGSAGSPNPQPDGGSRGAASKGLGTAWPRRMLAAGGWVSLVHCLGSQPDSTAMQQVVAIGVMYLAKEVGTSEGIASRPGMACPSSDRHI